MTDAELLQRYVRDGSSAAFAELVGRHLDLVYSVARRHLGSTAAAEDVAQSVFLDLARHAARLRPDTPLVAWLHTVARRTAIDTVRRDSRRRAREQHAATLAAPASPAMPAPSPEWPAIEPLLDEAVESLPPADRTAILLRFFENKSLRDIGAALGTSDDAAQKRVSRALDQLRTFLARRGVATSAAALGADLSAATLHSAPAGLAAAISSAPALATLATASAPAVAMTTLQKTLAASVFVLTAGTAAFQARALHRDRAELDRLAADSATLAAELARVRSTTAAVQTRLAAIDRQIDARLARPASLPLPLDADLEEHLRVWRDNAARLKDHFAARSESAIPELRLLTEEDWLEIVSRTGTAPLTPTRLAAAAAHARNKAQSLFAPRLQAALKSYLRSNGDILPESLDRLLPHFSPPAQPELLARYELHHRGKLDDVPTHPRNNALIATRSVVDPARDAALTLGLLGWATHTGNSPRAPAPQKSSP